MRRFLIHGMYTDGPNKGKGFLLKRGGSVVDVHGIKPAICDTYASESTAKAVANRYNNRNKFDVKHHNANPCVYSVSDITY